MGSISNHWQMVASGLTVLNSTPQQLWEAACSYFKWCDEHPITAKRTLTSGKTQGEKVTVEFVRPYTVKALCLHCNISQKWLDDIKNTHKEESEYYIVLQRILYIIYSQNIEGAMVDIFNPIITSKVLKLDGDQGEQVANVKIEFVNSQSSQLSNSELDVLKKLDFEKLNLVKDKAENLERQNSEKTNEHTNTQLSALPDTNDGKDAGNV